MREVGCQLDVVSIRRVMYNDESWAAAGDGGDGEQCCADGAV
jgi:hypothetical protein